MLPNSHATLSSDAKDNPNPNKRKLSAEQTNEQPSTKKIKEGVGQEIIKEVSKNIERIKNLEEQSRVFGIAINPFPQPNLTTTTEAGYETLYRESLKQVGYIQTLELVLQSQLQKLKSRLTTLPFPLNIAQAPKIPVNSSQTSNSSNNNAPFQDDNRENVRNEQMMLMSNGIGTQNQQQEGDLLPVQEDMQQSKTRPSRSGKLLHENIVLEKQRLITKNKNWIMAKERELKFHYKIPIETPLQLTTNPNITDLDEYIARQKSYLNYLSFQFNHHRFKKEVADLESHPKLQHLFTQIKYKSPLPDALIDFELLRAEVNRQKQYIKNLETILHAIAELCGFQKTEFKYDSVANAQSNAGDNTKPKARYKKTPPLFLKEGRMKYMPESESQGAHQWLFLLDKNNGNALAQLKESFFKLFDEVPLADEIREKSHSQCRKHPAHTCNCVLNLRGLPGIDIVETIIDGYKFAVFRSINPETNEPEKYFNPNVHAKIIKEFERRYNIDLDQYLIEHPELIYNPSHPDFESAIKVCIEPFKPKATKKKTPIPDDSAASLSDIQTSIQLQISKINELESALNKMGFVCSLKTDSPILLPDANLLNQTKRKQAKLIKILETINTTCLELQEFLKPRLNSAPQLNAATLAPNASFFGVKPMEFSYSQSSDSHNGMSNTSSHMSPPSTVLIPS